MLLPQEVLNISLPSRCIEEIVSQVSPPFQSRCKESRWTGAGPPGDRRGQERLSGSLWGRVVQLNHSPTLRAPQSYAAVKKAVIRRNVVPTRTVLHCDKTCGAHMCCVHTGHVRIGDDMFYTQHVPQSIQVLRTLPPTLVTPRSFLHRLPPPAAGLGSKLAHAIHYSQAGAH